MPAKHQLLQNWRRLFSAVMVMLALNMLLSGCSPQEREEEQRKSVRTIYYDGPELDIVDGSIGAVRQPGQEIEFAPGEVVNGQIEEDGMERDEEAFGEAIAALEEGERQPWREIAARAGFLQWLPRNEPFLEWLPREERQPAPVDDAEDRQGVFARLFAQHQAQLTVAADNLALNFIDEPLIRDAPALEYNLPVRGYGEAGGSEAGMAYATSEDSRFAVLLENFYVDYYVVDAHNVIPNADVLTGIGLGVTGQSWSWKNMSQEHWKYNHNMPWQNATNTENVRQLGLKIRTASQETPQRRSFYFARINITDGERDITIRTVPTGNATYPGGERYNGWLVEIENYIDGQILQIASGPAGTMTWPGQETFEGAWLDGRKHGTGTYRWPGGMTLQAQWENGQVDGRGTLVWPNRTQEYNGFWQDSRFHGQGTMTWYVGAEPVQSYTGLWREGSAHGVGRLTFTDGREYVGGWVDGVIQGRGRMIFPDGRVYTGGWREGQPHGRGAMRLPEGLLYRGVWNNGAPVGRGVFIPREDR